MERIKGLMDIAQCKVESGNKQAGEDEEGSRRSKERRLSPEAKQRRMVTIVKISLPLSTSPSLLNHHHQNTGELINTFNVPRTCIFPYKCLRAFSQTVVLIKCRCRCISNPRLIIKSINVPSKLRRKLA